MSSIEELKYKRLHIIKNADQKIRSYKEVKWSENWFSCSFANEGNTFSCGIAWLLDFNLWDLIKYQKQGADQKQEASNLDLGPFVRFNESCPSKTLALK